MFFPFNEIADHITHCNMIVIEREICVGEEIQGLMFRVERGVQVEIKIEGLDILLYMFVEPIGNCIQGQG